MTKRTVERPGQDAQSILERERWFVETAMPELHRQYRLRQLDPEQFKDFIAHRNPFETPGWILKRKKEMDARLQSFFGKPYDLTLFQESLKRHGKEQVERWETMGLKVSFLPSEKMTRDRNIPGWKVQPDEWLYRNAADGKLLRLNAQGELAQDKKADELEGCVVLFDTRCKPPYQDGKQMWQDDYLGPLIASLRQQGKLARYVSGPQDSRFGISMEPEGEWEQHLKPVVAEFLGVTKERERLERATESIMLSQLYADLPRGQDGTTNTWLWFEEFFGGASRRLRGGLSKYGGLANVGWYDSANRWLNISPRPLAEL